MAPRRRVAPALLLVLWCVARAAAGEVITAAGGLDWTNRPPWNSPDFFPLAVWLQSPANAARYKAAGINCYVGLWRGPTEEQLATLKAAGMPVICDQTAVGLAHREDPGIIGWMHGDEPDNAQALEDGKGWGPPIPPETIVADYGRIRAADSSRPVLLNLGQGVAWDGWYGRGVRSNHPEDYPRYIRGADIVSFDIYPVVHDREEVAGKLWLVPHGVERLVRWSEGRKMVWNCLECTHIGNPNKKATPRQVRCQAWMSIIHGSQGLIYFVHQFKPQFREAALLDDPEMLAAITDLNREITQLARVIRSPGVAAAVEVRSGNDSVPIACSARKVGGTNYLFAVAMREGATTAHFRTGKIRGPIEVLGEKRTVPASGDGFSDKFEAWDAHVYRYRE